MDVKNRITRVLLLAVVSSLLFACGGGGGESNNNVPIVDNGDATPPTLSITSPSTGPNYTTNNNTVSIAGIATDDVGVTEITWSNDRGGTGSVNGSTNWSYNDIALSVGDNVITVTAKDANSNSTESTITVTSNVNDANRPLITITSPVPNSGNEYDTDINRVSIAGTSSDNIIQ